MNLADELLRIEKMLKQEGVPPETRIKALSEIQQTLEAADREKKHRAQLVRDELTKQKGDMRRVVRALGWSKTTCYRALKDTV